MKEGRMNDPNDRDRQQRELTEELRRDADRRAARKRIEEEHQRQAPCDQPLSADEIRDWAADVAQQTNGAHLAATASTPR
jgi:transposase